VPARIAPEERPRAAMFGAKVGSLHGEGDGVMAYDADAAIELEIERLRSKRHRYSERQEVLPAIKMIIGDWYVDELGMPTRQITARQ
jgi:aminopeptidase C